MARNALKCAHIFTIANRNPAPKPVRIRRGRSPAGEMKSAWVVDYFDQHGDRHLKTFAKKRDADSYHAQVAVDVRAGTHTADSGSISVAQAGQLWLQDRA